jgi:outer membrane protein assembly factor BamE (lipoprotein component of BamABCDE complex)
MWGMTAFRFRRPHRSASLGAILSVIALTALVGCETIVHTRGNMPDAKLVAEIKPGRTNRADIEELLGTPSTRATFNKEIWLYIGSREETHVFKKPKLIERRILTIRFNNRGIVEETQNYDATNGRLVQIVKQKTPTRGRELTFIEQLIGNFGRFGDTFEKTESPY